MRSIDKDHAGRNAAGVKGPPPDKLNVTRWPSQYRHAKTAPVGYVPTGTTVVQDHGMYERLIQKPGRSARNERNPLREQQVVKTKLSVGLGLELKHKPRGRMRKLRTYGSKRSFGRQLQLFT